MNKIGLKCVLSSAFLVSLSAQATTSTIITDDNIDQYLNFNKKTLVGTQQSDSFVLVNRVTLPNGLVKNKYVQQFNGVPIFNSVLTSSEVDGEQMHWYGEMALDIQEDLKSFEPKYSEGAILDLIKKRAKINNSTFVQNENAKLFVWVNEDNKAELVYLVSYYLDGQTPSRPHYIVNAHTGKVIKSWEGLNSRQASGPGGNTKVGNYNYGSNGYPFLEVSDGCAMTTNYVDTINMQNQTTGQGVLYRFTCPTNTFKFTNGAYSPLNDAHYFANMVYNMYEDWYKFDPLKMKLRVRVHYGFNLRQAFWNGREMTFGDGDANTFPFTALDVMGHEVSHGVTELTSNLVYEKQSGGINEAFSDMAGEAVEEYAQLGGKGADWLGGAMIMKNAEALRFFAEPKKDGMSISHQSEYHDGLDVHFSSGIYNKAYYLLANKPSWGIKKAFEVFLLANRVHWKPESTFDSAACGVANAARDLNYEVSDVVSVFKDVGVNAVCSTPPGPGPDPLPGKEIVLQNESRITIDTKAGEEYRYAITVPRLPTSPFVYRQLQISVGNATINASKNVELFVRYENNGPLQKLEPVARSFADNQELFMITYPNAGNYHILIKAKGADRVLLYVAYRN